LNPCHQILHILRRRALDWLFHLLSVHPQVLIPFIHDSNHKEKLVIINMKYSPSPIVDTMRMEEQKLEPNWETAKFRVFLLEAVSMWHKSPLKGYVLGTRRHDGAILWCAKLCDGAIEQIELIEEIDR
jgi:hypothetical protein